MTTAQEIFDTVATHLLTQKARAYDEEAGQCLYRTTDGKKCAVGILIDDEAYEELVINEYDRFAVTDLPEHVLKACGIINDNDHIELATQLQNVHDLGTAHVDRSSALLEDLIVASWPTALREVAKEHKLDARVVDELTRDDEFWK